ncbi:MAG: DUF4189 domain-containing protein [Pseudomonadota bacterium]
MSKRAIMLAAAVSIFLSAGPAAAKDKDYKWGAIAVDLEKADRDPSYGVGGGDTEDEAKDNSLKFCKEAGGKACKPVVAYQECGAYAASRKSGGWGMNTTQKTAEAKALSGCDDDSCKIVVSDCN